MPVTYIKGKPKNLVKPVPTTGKAQLKAVPTKVKNNKNQPDTVMVRILKINRWIFKLERTETDKDMGLSLSAKKMVLLVLANNIDNDLRTTKTIKWVDIAKYANMSEKTVKKALKALAEDKIIESIETDVYKINFKIEPKIKGIASNKEAMPLATRIVNYNRSLFFSAELGYKIKMTERLLLIGLVDRASKGFRVRTPISVIRNRTGLSTDTQNNAVSELIDRKLLNTYSCKEGEDTKKMVTMTYILGTELMDLWEERRKQNKAKDKAYKENYG